MAKSRTECGFFSAGIVMVMLGYALCSVMLCDHAAWA